MTLEDFEFIRFERHPDGLRGTVVHRESEARPVRGGSEPALLAEHDLARLVDEPPHALEIALAAQGFARLPLRRDDLVEHVLRGDRRVVEAGQEQRGVALHAGVPNEQVLDRRALRVTQVQ